MLIKEAAGVEQIRKKSAWPILIIYSSSMKEDAIEF